MHAAVHAHVDRHIDEASLKARFSLANQLLRPRTLLGVMQRVLNLKFPNLLAFCYKFLIPRFLNNFPFQNSANPPILYWFFSSKVTFCVCQYHLPVMITSTLNSAASNHLCYKLVMHLNSSIGHLNNFAHTLCGPLLAILFQ